MPNRTMRKYVLRQQRAVVTGAWGEWEEGPLPPPTARGWLADVDRVVKNHVVCVLIRTLRHTEWGEVQHAAIRNYSSTDVPWAVKQRIKDELFGTGRVAVEVFPSANDLVDDANMYHLWILPEGFTLPLTLRR